MSTTTRSRAEILGVLRRAGYDTAFIAELELDLPDPVDLDRDGHVFERHGLSREHLENDMGSSP